MSITREDYEWIIEQILERMFSSVEFDVVMMGSRQSVLNSIASRETIIRVSDFIAGGYSSEYIHECISTAGQIGRIIINEVGAGIYKVRLNISGLRLPS